MHNWAKGRLWITSILFCFAFIFIVFSIFHQCRKLALDQAENNLSAFLLNHKATRDYVEYTQKPEIYRLKKTQRLYEEYFSPKLLSGTFISRNINELQNKSRNDAGLEEIYFKFASPNPRNPSNKADSAELELLAAFNSGKLKEYQELVHIGDDAFLYYALPIDRNMVNCLKCHGDPVDAPQEMIDLYGDTAGFYEEVGYMRGLMSVRIPVNQLLAKADRTASILSVITFFLLSGAFTVVHLLFREADKQKKIALNNFYYLNSVLQSSIDTAILAIAPSYDIEYCNNAAENIFQLPVGEVLNHNFLDLAERIGVPASSYAERVVDIVNRDGSFQFCFELDGKTLEAQVTKITGPENDHAGFLFMVKDITERINKEKEREEIKNRLTRAEKMESIALLAGGVAHDLNNILSGIINYPELLLLKLPEDSTLRPTIKAIQQSGQRAAAVVEDLLMVARGIACKKETLDLNQLVNEYLCSPEFQKLQENHSAIIVTADLSEEQLPVHCSAIHVKKCVMNLVGNALEAMDQSGYCQISTGRCRFDPQTTGKLSVESGEYCFIRVSDSGPGIAQEDLQHIFEPFYSSKRMGRSGTGLGLSVVWNAMKDHNGAVEVESDSNGSIFTLYYPQCPEGPDVENGELQKESLYGAQEKILIVDDEPQQRDIAQQMLGELHYDVAAVCSGEEAIRYLTDNNVDLILIDMIMPSGMNGLQTYLEIVAIRPAQKAMIVSGFSEDSDVKAALAAGAKNFISKPYSLRQLGRLVKATLQS
ncbi:ATP-binding response regulator [Desulfogranum japonicum]|uniref:ATP-binding response regulator n=1 Tax=Desulfogranum japonicum TaxID=231447 RepID=UPI00048EC696|nr:DUF3365 domain-containing protein [Desulfogranum japonicum]